MDDYHTDSLYESRNEWMARFVNTLIPHLNEELYLSLRKHISYVKIMTRLKNI